MPQQNNQTLSPVLPFSKKVWIATGIVAFTTVVLLLFKAVFNVLLLIFAGVLIAVFLRGLSGFIQRKTKWKEGVCVAISIIGSLLIISLLFWLIGVKIQAQIVELTETLPKTFAKAKEQLQSSPIGKKLLDKMSSQQSMEKTQAFIQKFFQTTFGIFGDIYAVLYIGIFFTVSPHLYTKNMVKLTPEGGQAKAVEVLKKTGTQLRKWIKGQLFAMFIVFTLTAIGLFIMDIPLWLVLALLAGMLSFIPNLGPLIALIPAVLVGFLQSPLTALLVASLYITIQFVESNFITPMVQKKLISMPPALIIIAQLILGVASGGWGLLLATPLTVVVIVLVQELYLKNRSGE